MGISANYIQQQDIKSHTIIELNDEIYQNAVEWAKDKPNTKIVSGDWKTVELGEKFDIFLTIKNHLNSFISNTHFI